MSHQPRQPLPAQPHGGDTDPNETRRQQNVSQSHGQMSPQSHGGNTDPNEIRRGQSNTQTSMGQQSSGQYTQASPTVPISSPNISRASSQATQQQAYQPTPHVSVWYGPPQSGQPQPQHSQAAYYQGTRRPDAHYMPAEQTPAQTPAHGIQPVYGGNPYPHRNPYPHQTPSSAQAQPPNGGNGTSRGLQPQPVNQEVDSSPNVDTAEKQNYQYLPKQERGYSNISHPRGLRRWKFPNYYQPPGIPHPEDLHSHHRDAMGRSKYFMPGDYYLSPTDFHLAKLMVQCSQEVYDANPNCTWRRTFVRDASPLLLRVANWVLESIPNEERPMTQEEATTVAAKWIPAIIAILFLLSWPNPLNGEVRNGGKYDQFPYKYWGYPYRSRNNIEDKPLSQNHFDPYSSSGAEDLNPNHGMSDRPIEPNFLCFLKAGGGVYISDVEKWKRDNPGHVVEYIFVSYTSEQFKNDQEKLLLHDVGELAARKAGVPAYWVGSSCLGNDDQMEENVWRISDIIRGSHSMAIVLSNPIETNQVLPREDLLKQWGSRVWTLPEILLCPGTQEITVYTRDEDDPIGINKRNMAAQIDDGKLSRQLIDHYEGSVVLGPLELITIALRCLHGREKGSYLKGDMSYALMGLLRQRPTVVRGDSAFQAFARLSLANDSNMLLERLICILPKRYDQPWHNTDDQWNVPLWDIYPTTQICGIGEQDTVILDNAHAANIRWKSFTQVLTMRRDNIKRQLMRLAFRSTFYLLFMGAVLLILSATFSATYGSALVALGAIFLTIGLILTLLSPYLIRQLYGGKIWGTQPWFFGFEGYMSLPAIERHIFGADMGRMNWSTNGSPLSRHRATAYDECEGLDPTTDSDTAARVRRAIHTRMGEEKIFTLVDTYTMTVTMFAAVRPPVAVVLCGQEGGMQRALLCSYEHKTQTLYRETVLRMETPVLEVMSRLGRFRIGLNRLETNTPPS